MKCGFPQKVKSVAKIVLIAMLFSCFPKPVLGYSISLPNAFSQLTTKIKTLTDQKPEDRLASYQARTEATKLKIRNAHAKADNVLQALTKPINDRITPQTNQDLVFAYGVLEGIPKAFIGAYKSGYSALTWSNPLNLRAGIMTSYHENPEAYQYMATHLPQTASIIAGSLYQDGLQYLDSITRKDNPRGSGNFFGEVLAFGGIFKAAGAVAKGVSIAVQTADKATKAGNAGATILGSRAVPTAVAAGRTVYTAPKMTPNIIKTASKSSGGKSKGLITHNAKGSGAQSAKGQTLQGDLLTTNSKNMVVPITPVQIDFLKGIYYLNEKPVTGDFIGVIRVDGKAVFAPFRLDPKTLSQYTKINREKELIILQKKEAINGKKTIVYTPQEFPCQVPITHSQLAGTNGPQYPVRAAFNAVFDQEGKLLKWNDITLEYGRGNTNLGLLQKALPTANWNNWRAFEFFDLSIEQTRISKTLKKLNLKRFIERQKKQKKASFEDDDFDY